MVLARGPQFHYSAILGGCSRFGFVVRCLVKLNRPWDSTALRETKRQSTFKRHNYNNNSSTSLLRLVRRSLEENNKYSLSTGRLPRLGGRSDRTVRT